MTTENVGGIEYTVDANVDPLLKANKQVDSSLDAVQKGFNDTAKASTTFDNTIKKTSASVRTANSGMRSLKGSAQNLGFQLQDVAVQAQMGTNALVILGQQGSQVLSSFGATGAIAGAFVAIGAALSGVLLTALNDTDNAVEELDESIKALDATARTTETGVTVLSDKIAELAMVSRDAALAEISVGLANAQNVILGSAGAIGELTDEFDLTGLASSRAADELERFRASGRDLNETLDGISNRDAARLNIGRLSDSVGVLTEQFDISVNQATDLIERLSEVEKTKSPEAIQALAKFVSDLSSQTGFSNKNLNTFNAEVNRSAITVSTAKNNITLLENALKNLDQALKDANESSEESVGAYNDANNRIVAYGNAIAIAKLEAQGLKREATQLNAVLRLGEGATQAQKDAITLLSGELFDVRENAKNAKDELKDLTPDRSQPISIFDTAQGGFGTVEPDAPQTGASQFNQDLQESLSITEQVANQIEMLDQRMMNLGTTLGDTLVTSALSFSDTLGQGLAQGIADGENLNDVFRNIAGTIGTQLLGQLISIGLQYGINAALKATADQTEAASGAAAAGVATAAGVASATTLAAAYAPAAAAASVATFGAAAVAGTAALTTTYATSNALALSGGRQNGGPVSAGNAYQVTEDGNPEMLTVGGKNILMMGSQGGTVTSNKDMMSSGSGGDVTVYVNNNAAGTEASATSRTQDGQTIIDVVVSNINSRGKIHKAMTDTTSANNKTRTR